jgi:hypothetical protein
LTFVNGIIPRKIDDFQDPRKSNKTTQKDIFEELLKISTSFLSANNVENAKLQLVRYAQDAAKVATRSSKQMVVDEIKKSFFASDGVCGANKTISRDTVTLKPTEFDFLNMLTIDPDSPTGKIMYESDEDYGYIKMNQILFELFNSGESYEFKTVDGQTIFTISWDDTNQWYEISGLQTASQLVDFFTGYYESIEYPNINDILKQTMNFVVHGDGTDPKTFTIGLDWLERLLQKLFSLCKPPQEGSELRQTTDNTAQEEDPEWYFNFEETEGINLDDEDARKRRVLKFSDCENFEIPINSNHQEDFIHFINKKPIFENTVSTLDRVASEAYEESNQSIKINDLQISIYYTYIKKIPKAIISSILSPKIFLPLVTMYKIIRAEIDNISIQEIDIKETMKKLSRLFYNVIRKTFWKFIREFWKLVKNDLMKFIKTLAGKIILDKVKRYKTIITSLINLLTQILDAQIQGCDELFSAILQTINTALNVKTGISPPGLLLAYSDALPGYSKDKATMNIVEILNNAGVPMGDLYGRPNKMITVIKGIIDGHMKEMDENSYIKVGIKFGQLPMTPAGVAIISPQNTAVGKLF